MVGMLFVVCIPTVEYEKNLLARTENSSAQVFKGSSSKREGSGMHTEQERGRNGTSKVLGTFRTRSSAANAYSQSTPVLPMEQILEDLLKKLEIEHVVWCCDKNGNYQQVIFPVRSGDPCENCLHCLTELGIGKKLNSVVSVVPCSVFYQQTESDAMLNQTEDIEEKEAKKKWNNFIQSIRSKLTVKQVVDGVRGGGECSFDYLLLVLTADMVAAVGLVENNAVNIVAAMLISPLMGPIMALSFGTVIADKKLQKIGIRSEFVGLFTSLIFGFIFGLLVGTTESPWGYGDWPTSEMKGRGDVRSLWVGILWALPSGTGVALALLQGSAGPLIGVAISASLLPPSVNCGLMWGLACIVLIYGKEVHIPHVKQEQCNITSQYKPLYSSWMPSELAVMGIVSFCLTLINICCIIVTAVIVLKIKEVAAPYTSSPDLRRFWQQDIRMARNNNRSVYGGRGASSRRNTDKELMDDICSIPPEELNTTLEAAVREAMDDATFRKVKRVSYSRGSADVMHTLGLIGSGSNPAHRTSFIPSDTTPLNDLATLDHLIEALLGLQKTQQQQQSHCQSPSNFTRIHPLSRSLRLGSTRSAGRGSARNSWLISQHSALNFHNHRDVQGQSPMSSNPGLPTILESNSFTHNSDNARTMSLSERALNVPIVRNFVSSISKSQRCTVSPSEDPLRNFHQNHRNSETISLTQNLDS